MNPLFAVLTRWAETIANAATELDPLTRARLERLSGHSIAIEIDPPGEAVTLTFDAASVRVRTGIGAAPSVIARGSPTALAGAFFDTNAGGHLSIDGDELLLSELRAIMRDFRPDPSSPLESLVGADAAQSIASLVELGISTLSAVGRSIGDEGARVIRRGAGQRYLTRPDLEWMLESMQSLRLRLDRLTARADQLERSRSEPDE